MTLKGFHLLFIACSSALAFLFGAWLLQSPAAGGAPRLAAFAAFAVGIALVVYETWFLKYLRRPR